MKELGSNETYPVYFASGYTRADPFTNSAHYIFAGTLGGDQFTLELNSLLTHATLITYGELLPEPNPDGSDNGKVPTLENNKWELKAPSGGGSADAVLYTPQTLTDAQKKQARQNIDAASDFVINVNALSGSEVTVDKTYAQVSEAIKAGKTTIVYILHRSVGPVYLRLFSYYEDQPITFSGNGEGEKYPYILSFVMKADGSTEVVADRLVEIAEDGTMRQVRMDGDPYSDMEIATKKYVDDHLSGAPITIKLGTGNAATSTATFAEIKAALEAGKAPILDSAPGTTHWFALNWTLSGSGSLSIQYGTFNVDGGGMANFTIDDVSVSSTGITYSSRQFTSQ